MLLTAFNTQAILDRRHVWLNAQEVHEQERTTRFSIAEKEADVQNNTRRWHKRGVKVELLRGVTTVPRGMGTTRLAGQSRHMALVCVGPDCLSNQWHLHLH
jgi:hypothetical protein